MAVDPRKAGPLAGCSRHCSSPRTVSLAGAAPQPPLQAWTSTARQARGFADMGRVVITGVGGVSGCGRDPDGMLDAIVEGRSAIRPIEGFDTTGWPVKHAAEIVDFNARSLVDDRKLHKLIRRTDMLGIYAGDRAAEAAGYATHRATLSPQASNAFADRTGIYVGSGAGAFENQHDFFPLMSESKGDLQAFGRNLADTVSPMWLLRTLPNNVLCHVGIRNRLKGTN